MLITERTSDGRTVVRLHKDWNPSRIGKAYTPPPQNNMESRYAEMLQTGLLNKNNYSATPWASNIRRRF
jgi:hypothetical protein